MGGSRGSWKTAKRKDSQRQTGEHLTIILPDSTCCSQRASIAATATNSSNSYYEVFPPCQELLCIVERMSIRAKCLISMSPLALKGTKRALPRLFLNRRN